MEKEWLQPISSWESNFTRLEINAVAFAPRLVTALLIILFFFVAARVTTAIMRRAFDARAMDRDVAGLLTKVTYITIMVLGLVTALGTVQIDVKALVAGLGLTGFALGFALKDSISNLLSGVMILMYRPFRRGDYIEVGGNQGVVMQTDLRYTVLETDDKRILIPNSTLFTTAVVVKRQAPTGTPS